VDRTPLPLARDSHRTWPAWARAHGYGEAEIRLLIKRVMPALVASRGYLMALARPGAMRHDPDGAVVEAVSEAHQLQAATMLAARKAKAEPSAKAEPPAQEEEARPSGMPAAAASEAADACVTVSPCSDATAAPTAHSPAADDGKRPARAEPVVVVKRSRSRPSFAGPGVVASSTLRSTFAAVVGRRNSARMLAIWSKRPDATRLIDAELQGITADVEAALERDGFGSSPAAVRRLVDDLVIDAGIRRRRVG
jgi:hypothetical protein